MPIDNVNKSKGKGHGPTSRQQGAGMAGRYDSDTDNPLPIVFRFVLLNLLIAIAQLVRPLTVTPEVPGLILGKFLGIFRDTFSVSHLPRGVLVRNPGNPRMCQCYTLGTYLFNKS